MKRNSVRVALLALGFAAAAPAIGPAPARAQEWTRFRGPNGSGIGAAVDLPDEWTDADINWRVELPGGGHGSPVLWGDRVFLLAARDDATRIVVCLHAGDGRTLWAREYPGTTFRMNALNSYAASTPAVDPGAVYVTWTDPEAVRLVALDHDGNEIWTRDFGPYSSAHGPGTSPVVQGGRVVLTNDHRGTSFVVAVDRRTGRTVWQLDRPGGRAAYAVPCIRPAEGGGVDLVLASDKAGLVGVDPVDGTVRWQRTDAFPARVVGSPVLAGRMMMATCGVGGAGKALTAVLPRPGGEPRLVYQLKGRLVPYVPTPLVRGDRTYLLHDRGRLTCVRTADGEELWQENLGEKFFASPVWIADAGGTTSGGAVAGQPRAADAAAGDASPAAGSMHGSEGRGRLLLVSTEGNVHVVRVGRGCQRLAVNPLGEKSHATPAVAGGRVYVRTWSHLVSVGGRRAFTRTGSDDRLTGEPLYESGRVEVSGVEAAWGLCDVGHQGLFFDKEFGQYYNRRRQPVPPCPHPQPRSGGRICHRQPQRLDRYQLLDSAGAVRGRSQPLSIPWRRTSYSR